MSRGVWSCSPWLTTHMMQAVTRKRTRVPSHVGTEKANAYVPQLKGDVSKSIIKSAIVCVGTSRKRVRKGIKGKGKEKYERWCC